ncbi:MAG: winged helix-turn-helix transcriptional regulator [Candidatus Diapherotrites archaeon]
MAVKIDKTDRRLLFELDRDCRLPMTVLAKRIRKSRPATEYRLNRLLREGVITHFGVNINPHRLGLRVWKIYLQLKNKQAAKKRMLNFLLKNRNVNWVGECDGSWDLIFSACYASDYEFFAFRNRFFSDFGDLVLNSHTELIIDVHSYPKMYFMNELCTPVQFGAEISNAGLDETDVRVLSLLAKDARMHVTELARGAGITPAIAAHRLKKLSGVGAISQFRISVDLGTLGLQLYKAIIYFQKYSEKDEKRLEAFVSGIPNTQYFIRDLTQIEVELVAGSHKEYNEIIGRIKSEFAEAIRNVESVILKSDYWSPAFVGAGPSRAAVKPI